jgi:hypothetical protein
MVIIYRKKGIKTNKVLRRGRVTIEWAEKMHTRFVVFFK